MTGRDWLIAVIVLTVVAAVGVPLLGSVIRSRDFQAQVSGKKPVRDFDEKRDRVDAAQDPAQKQPELESAKVIAELKSKQNILGPK